MTRRATLLFILFCVCATYGAISISERSASHPFRDITDTGGAHQRWAHNSFEAKKRRRDAAKKAKREAEAQRYWIAQPKKPAPKPLQQAVPDEALQAKVDMLQDGVMNLQKQLRELKLYRVLGPKPSWERSEGGGGGSEGGYDSLFELYDVTTTSYWIRGIPDTNYVSGAFVGGADVTITGGEHVVFMGTNYFVSGMGADDVWVVFQITRGWTNTASIEVQHHVWGSDNEEEFPLWYVPIDTNGLIDSSGILDCRFTKHWIGGS